MTRYAIAIAVLLLVLIILALFLRWALLPARYLPGNRVRSLQVRLHLRLHPARGFATVLALHLRWGRLAALRRSARIRRSLPLWVRALAPGEHSVFLGRAHWRHRLHVPLEEHVLVMAPPRTFKTAFLADVILRYPGPVIATTTKADVHHLTAAVRSLRGRVHVFNPQHIGGVPSTFRWSPLDGCEDPATAIRRADAFAFAVSREGVEDGTFWSAKASDYLRGYFCAAALAGYDMQTVAAWVSGARPDEPERILAAAGARQWALTLAELRSEAHKTAATVRMVMSRALSFMADPDLAASVLPGPGDGFSIPGFLAGRGTLYMIAEATGEDAPVAPLFAAMATEIHYAAALTGQASPSGRLDPPLLMGLDEVTQICPVPLPAWLSDSGGKGIQVIAVVHGEAQLAGRWADHGRQVVWDTSSVKVFLPGITDTTTLQAASVLCGQASWKTRGQPHRDHYEIATPDMIRQLPTGFALVIRGGYAPVIARLPRAWNNPDYRRARRRHRTLPARPYPLSAPATHRPWTGQPPDDDPGLRSWTGQLPEDDPSAGLWNGHPLQDDTDPGPWNGMPPQDDPAPWNGAPPHSGHSPGSRNGRPAKGTGPDPDYEPEALPASHPPGWLAGDDPSFPWS
jgi:type IV secretory pathway TraG/TraD family ATPase VirD4